MDTKFIFWISKPLLSKVQSEAAEEGLTVAELIRGLLRAWLAKLATPVFGENGDDKS